MQDMGYIYFIAARINGTIDAVKIGFSNEPERRLKELRTGSSADLELLGWMPGTRDDERALHHAFDEHRRSGEWFNPADPVRDIATWAGVMSKALPSWEALEPFPREQHETVSHESLRAAFGENVFLVDLLMEFAPRGLSSRALMVALCSVDGLDPAGKAMDYGLRAAIRQGKAAPSYVVRCAEMGVEQGSVYA